MNQAWQMGRNPVRSLRPKSSLPPTVEDAPARGGSQDTCPPPPVGSAPCPCSPKPHPLLPSPELRRQVSLPSGICPKSLGFIFLQNPDMYISNKFGHFLLLISHLNLIISPAKRTLKGRRLIRERERQRQNVIHC